MNKYMKVAYNEALKAFKKNEVPVGVVIVKNDKIVSKARNNRQKTQNLLGHAEINCILKAEKKLKDWRLDGCEMYVTLAPCDMCKLHIKEARIKKTYFLVAQPGFDTDSNGFEQTNDCSVLAESYKYILSSFFENLRK